MSQADERIVMQDGGAYGTVEVPAAPKKKGSLKRLVASVGCLCGNQNFMARSRRLDSVVLVVPRHSTEPR